ncbi:MAG TPA: hypothetical protein VF158_05375 [Longimicrobiales bacterium]
MSSSAFRDLTGLTAILEACLAAYLVVSLIGIWSGWGELQLLQKAMAGAEITEAEATASDTRQAMAGLLRSLTLIVTGVVFARWAALVLVSRLGALQAEKHARLGVAVS